jgi:UDP:flavonoid glycosyltransferase YjiC (YdhE family)
MSKRIVIACWGSHGDLNPYIGLAVALKKRGHRPVVATMPLYRENVEKEGLEFAAVGAQVDPDDRELMARVMHPTKGTERIVRELVLPAIRQTYDEMHRTLDGADLAVGHPLTYTLPIIAERERLPWLSTALAPISFLSETDLPVFPMFPWLLPGSRFNNWLLRAIKKLAHRQIDGWVGPVYRLRAELGLPRGGNPVFEGQFSPFGTLALYSRVLGGPQPDWPANVTMTGCVFYNGPDGLGPELERFLAAGPPPLVFTLGTSAVGAAGRFYHESAAAAVRLGMRAVLLTGGLEQNRPDGPLPDGVLLVDRAPHQLLFPHAAAVVHQCGAGTLGQALRSGKPMLAVPHAHDQPDNALRLTKLGVARTVRPKQYTAARVARELTLLLEGPYRQRAEEVAAVVRQEGGADEAVAAIELVLL